MQQAARVSDRTAFFTANIDGKGHRYGQLVEYDRTSKIFTNPDDPRTEDYISGRLADAAQPDLPASPWWAKEDRGRRDRLARHVVSHVVAVVTDLVDRARSDMSLGRPGGPASTYAV